MTMTNSWHNNNTSSFILMSCLVLLASLCIKPAQASVVMVNTRVIFASGAQSQTVQLTNNDNIPYVMQMWTDINNPESTPDNADGPFLVMPAMFRIEPKSGQSVRLTFTGKNLPQDRESVFYLNSTQIPPRNIAGAQENQMTVVLRNRIKIFYRPKGIVGRPEQITEKVNFSLSQRNGQWELTARNDSGYYASFIRAAVVIGNREVPFTTDMVAPKSQAVWRLQRGSPSPAGAKSVRFTLVNDHGGHSTAELPLR